jgi:hypothetical protein
MPKPGRDVNAEGHEECIVNETRSFTLTHESCICIEVFHKSVMSGDPSIGKGIIYLDEVRRSGRHELLQPLHHKGKTTGEVEVKLVLTGSQVLSPIPRQLVLREKLRDRAASICIDMP